jgi:hypothetical protein
MVAEGIYLQMGTQLGKKGENAFDNLDEVLAGQTADGQGHFLGSFGKGDIVFDAPQVADLHTRWFLQELLQESWLLPADTQVTTAQAAHMLEPLSAETVRSQLLRDAETGADMQVELALPGWLRRKGADEIAGEVVQYVQEFGLARIQEFCLPTINQQGVKLAQATCATWTTWLQSVLFSPDMSLATVIHVLHQCRQALTQQAQQVQKQLSIDEQQLLRLAETVSQLETAVSRAAASFPMGRKGRIDAAVKQYFDEAQSLYETQVAHQLNRSQRTLWVDLSGWLQTQIKTLSALQERLHTIATHLAQESPERLQKLAKNGISSFSLAEPDLVARLYQQHKPGWTDVQARLGDGLALSALDTEALQSQCLTKLSGYFEAVAHIGIEQIIANLAADMTPRARRQQVFRLATPSWNLDRSRLADGGAGLVQLEVLGVPDADDTLFEGEPMLVSTHDPYRLTALVVVAGAPASALQQYDLYQQAIETHVSKRPLYILPDFLSTHDQGRLTFALSSIFDFIYNQGTFFYYRPEDDLDNAIKLANGLSNAIDAFVEQETLVAEADERVNARITSLGLREAIEILTAYYSNVPTNTSLEEPLRELKRLVRDYTNNLRGIDEFKEKGRRQKDEG